MGSRVLRILSNFRFKCSFAFASPSSKPFILINNNHKFRNFSTKTTSSLELPDIPRLAEAARISLSPNEIEEFAPKMGQVIDWFGQLQTVDLDNVEPAIRADTEADHLRKDVAIPFGNKEELIKSIPSYEEPYIKVPKVLNKQ